MNEKDKQMLDRLLEDKGKRYLVVIDNDAVWVTDKDNDGEMVHEFHEFGYYLLQQVFEHLGMDAEFC